MTEPSGEIHPNIEEEKINTFFIDLNTPEKFNLEEFESEMEMLRNGQPKEGFMVKWIVKGNKLIIFPKGKYHFKVNDSIEETKENELKSAGVMGIFHLDEKTTFLVHSYSGSIAESPSFKLSKADSDKYKNGPLRDKLAAIDPHFKIGD